MLLIGLTGGIASGKSTVARRLATCGAVVVDADVLARQVLEPGTPGLAAVVGRFGADLLEANGTLNRGALARVVFEDATARRDLEAIVHPAVAAAFQQEVARLRVDRPDSIVVHDVPLLVENGLAPAYHLVLVAEAPQAVRVARAVTERGMAPQDVAARIAAQATDDARHAVADVLLDTAGSLTATHAAIDDLWRKRLVPFEAHLRDGRCASRPPVRLVADDAGDPWTVQAERALARIRRAGGDFITDASHIGSTAVPGLAAHDVLDLQVGVGSLTDAAALAPLLGAAGYPLDRTAPPDTRQAGASDPAHGRTSLHGSADPGRPVTVQVRVRGSLDWERALAFRDWLRAEPQVRAEYLAVKRAALDAGERAGAGRARADSAAAYLAAKEAWFTAAAPRLAAWRERTGWQPEPVSR